ncbi:hypothetical protein LTR37_017081 [Vermiconidia calcicola]|uniref:Uncharacterized protein n=1 Tax=Vermiconidia calcicola TaxID=1690605 RepID=A0ACC3MM66_9PEZI|nr:hypothetical protein LTR37_017081 [Vermiconidia calcicola]
MSDNESQARTRDSTPSRAHWSLFSQSVCQLLHDGLFVEDSATLCESRVLHMLSKVRREVRINGRRKLIIVVQALERAPADAFIAVIDLDEAQNVPLGTASDYERWKWARSKPSGVDFIALDAKLNNLTIGQQVTDQNASFYCWTKTRDYRDRVEDSEVIFGIVEGVDDHIAVVPTATWVASPDVTGTYGIETLTSRAPVWVSLFMVHLDDLAEAVVRVAITAVDETGESCYINPTDNKARLRGWKPRTTTRPRLDPDCNANTSAKISHTATLRRWKEIEQAGWTIVFNPVKPSVHDVSIYSSETGLLRLEEKDFDNNSLPNLVSNISSRGAALVERRMWHVVYVQTQDGVICMTRDEVTELRGKRPSKNFIAEHTWKNFKEASKHIRAHAVDAKRAVQHELRKLKPADISRGLPEREITLGDLKRDPLGGLRGAQTTLPWVSREVNYQCLRDRFGVCLPLGAGHPLGGTHSIVDYDWKPCDVTRYCAQGRLPLDPWSGKEKLTCAVLRFQDHSPRAHLKPLGLGLAVLKAHWKKTVKGKRCLILGARLPHELHRTGEPRNASYLLIPDGFTVLGADQDNLKEASDKSTGDHFFRRDESIDNQLRNPAWGTKGWAIVMGKKFFVDKRTNALRYNLNLANGMLNQQLKDLLRSSDGTTSIDNPNCPGNEVFEVASYIFELPEVRELGWDYGYERKAWQMRQANDQERPGGQDVEVL